MIDITSAAASRRDAPAGRQVRRGGAASALVIARAVPLQIKLRPPRLRCIAAIFASVILPWISACALALCACNSAALLRSGPLLVRCDCAMLRNRQPKSAAALTAPAKAAGGSIFPTTAGSAAASPRWLPLSGDDGLSTITS